MKKTQLYLIFILLITVNNTFAQKSQKEIRQQERKVDTMFTVQERSNLQLWFYDEIKKMNLSDEVEEEYYRIVLHYAFYMTRLDDKDKDFTTDERKNEFEKIVGNLNSKVKNVLSESDYEAHLSTFNQILKSVYERSGWEWEEN